MNSKVSTYKINYTLVIIGFVLFFSTLVFLHITSNESNVAKTALITFLMAYLWITEAVPIGLTSLLPLILFPFLGVLDGGKVANTYINSVTFLFIGGFIMALAVEKVGLHKRIALNILKNLGTSLNKILFSFMLVSAFLSSNIESET